MTTGSLDNPAAENLEMKKAVLFIGNFLDSFPLERYVSGNLANRLSDRGWRCWITSRKQNRLARLADMLMTTRTRRSDYEVALVDVFSGPAFFWAEATGWLLRRAGKPFALVLRGGDLPAFSRRFPKRVRRLLASANMVTTPSAYLREQMQLYCAEMRLIPNPVDVTEYEFRLRAAPRPEFVWLRAFHEIYNPSLAPLVISNLRTDFPDAHLTMTGPDKGDGSLARVRSIIEQSGLAGSVSLAESVDKTQVPTVVNRGDIFLNTTNFDNAPVSVVEAMACGLCVVSSNVGGIPYLLQDGHDALLVPPNDAPAMADAARRILQDQNLGASLSRNARSKAEGFDWSIILPQWERALCEAATKGQRHQQQVCSAGSS
jgi:glycosyltransferase involved in cell wall biosynthesis